MAYIWGLEPRSTYHKTCVRKVYRYLKNKCDKADYEKKLVADRITDALGYNAKSKIWYLCEIKVNWNDAQKGVTQIHDTAFRFRKTHRGYTVVPVLAIPSRLQKELAKFDNWNSLRAQCTNSGIAIWVIEQSAVREIMSPTTKAVKTKSAVTKAVKTKRPKTTKTRTTRTKTIARPKKSSVKSSTAKKTKTQSTKRKTSRVSVAKTRVARGKRKAD
ncbi:hypothetical protein ES706_06678 [subsurface metagenome]